MEPEDAERAIRLLKRCTLVILSGAAAFGIEIIFFIWKGWQQGLLWWLVTFPATTAWMTAPFAVMSAFAVQSGVLRQQVMFLFFSAGMALFSVILLYDVAFIHPDPRSWILFVLLPVYHWIVVGGVAALKLVLRK